MLDRSSWLVSCPSRAVAAGGRGLADDQLRWQEGAFARRPAGQSIDERAAGGCSQRVRRQADVRERWVEMASKRDFVEADDRYVGGDSATGLAKGAQRPEG